VPQPQRWLFDREKDPYEMRNVIDDPEYRDVAKECEERLQQWLQVTGDPFDTGKRLPQTGMLSLGQRFTHDKWLQQAPAAYVQALLQSYEETPTA
jgi:hypothetical protein